MTEPAAARAADGPEPAGPDPESAGPPWDPPLTDTDAEQIVAALDRQRATFRWKADGLDTAGLTTRVGASTLTLAGLLNHLAFVETLYSSHHLDGASVGEQWADLRSREGWDRHFQPDQPPETLYARYDETIARARQRFADAIADGGLDQPVALSHPELGAANLRRLLLDLLEEYGRHTGQADLLREAVDGRVGEDPPDEWLPAWY